MTAHNSSQMWSSNSDASKSSEYLAGVTALQSSLAYKQRNIQMLQLNEGQHILDVGCGIGDDLLLIAPFVGATGRAVGLDHNAELLQLAREKANGANGNIEFQVGDIEALLFPDNSFDAVRSARVFQHLADPSKALQECIRVTKPGGRVVISEPDWDTWLIDTGEEDIWSRLKQLSTTQNTRNGRMGSQLYRLYLEHGLTDVQVAGDTIIVTSYEIIKQLGDLDRLIALGLKTEVISKAEADRLLDDLEARNQRYGHFAAITLFTVSGIKAA